MHQGMEPEDLAVLQPLRVFRMIPQHLVSEFCLSLAHFGWCRERERWLALSLSHALRFVCVHICMCL